MPRPGADGGGTGTKEGPRWRDPSTGLQDTSVESSVEPYDIAVSGVCVNRHVRIDMTTTPLLLRRNVPRCKTATRLE